MKTLALRAGVFCFTGNKGDHLLGSGPSAVDKSKVSDFVCRGRKILHPHCGYHERFVNYFLPTGYASAMQAMLNSEQPSFRIV